jgi:uncharacterized membrane protein YbhN (UPF0104 family)
VFLLVFTKFLKAFALLEMVFILIMVFLAGIFANKQTDDKFIYVGLLIFGSGGILIKKRVKRPLKDSKPK